MVSASAGQEIPLMAGGRLQKFLVTSRGVWVVERWYWRVRVLPVFWAEQLLFRRAVRELSGPGVRSETVICGEGVELRITARRVGKSPVV